jgi:CMP-N-acetylneuraminic acid synthetase
MKKKIIGIIPARGGSKGIPKKILLIFLASH